MTVGNQMYDLIAFCKWCQELPLPELAKNIKNLGFDGVDFPCRPNAPMTHQLGIEKLPEAKRIFEDHGLELARLVTGLREVNDETERLLETINSIGVKKIRIGGYHILEGTDPRQLLDTARQNLFNFQALLEKHGVKGAIQNHSGNTLDVNISSCLLMLQDCDSQWLGVQYDPGHLAISGEPVSLAIGLLGDYLHSVNFKSPRQEYFSHPTTGRLTFKPIWVPLRDGMLDLPMVLPSLKAAGYTDPISIHAEYRSFFHLIEHHLKPTNTLVTADVVYVRQLMQELDI